MCQGLGMQYLIRQKGPISYETYSLKWWVETVEMGFVRVGQNSVVKEGQ